MTPEEIIAKLNEIRVTLKRDESLLLDLMNNIMGCDNYIEKLMGEIKKIEEAMNKEETEDA